MQYSIRQVIRILTDETGFTRNMKSLREAIHEYTWQLRGMFETIIPNRPGIPDGLRASCKIRPVDKGSGPASDFCNLFTFARQKRLVKN